MTIYSREKKELVIPSSNLELSIVYKEYYLKGYTEGYNEAMDNCKPDYLRTPFSIECLEDGESAIPATLYASVNGGSPYRPVKDETDAYIPQLILVKKGDIVEFWSSEYTTRSNMFFGDNDTYNIGFSSEYQVKFKAFGNVMSLFYGLDFENKTENKFSLSYMFNYCTSLTDASNLILPATTLTDNCYRGMFKDCTNLTTAPVLPATALANQCYSIMFLRCSNLVTAPELPSTTLAVGCYQGMFNGCTSLTQAPVLPATIMYSSCYVQMFVDCSSLTQAPVLPATTLAIGCYQDMFRRCTSLTDAPELSATTLANQCYKSMFQGCTSLTTAPELPATTLTSRCYLQMFADCTNLNYIKCLATDISAFECTSNWVSGVASTGTFKTPRSTEWSTGVSGIPSGWTRVNS